MNCPGTHVWVYRWARLYVRAPGSTRILYAYITAQFVLFIPGERRPRRLAKLRLRAQYERFQRLQQNYTFLYELDHIDA